MNSVNKSPKRVHSSSNKANLSMGLFSHSPFHGLHYCRQYPIFSSFFIKFLKFVTNFSSIIVVSRPPASIFDFFDILMNTDKHHRAHGGRCSMINISLYSVFGPLSPVKFLIFLVQVLFRTTVFKLF